MKNYFILGLAALSITSSFAQQKRWEKENDSYKPLPVPAPTSTTENFDAAGDKQFGRGYHTQNAPVPTAAVKPSEPYQPKVYALSSGNNEVVIKRSDSGVLTKEDYRAASAALEQVLNQGLNDTYAESVVVSVIVSQSSQAPSIFVQKNEQDQVTALLINVGQKTQINRAPEKHDTLASKILDELTP